MEAITALDFSILNFIQHTLRCALLDGVMAFFSYAGNAGLVWVIAAVVMLFFRKTRAAGVMMLTAMGIGYLLGDYVIKPLVQRPRPFRAAGIQPLIRPPKGFSFPSGHSCAAAAFVTVLLVKHRKLGYIAVVPAVLVMFSRLYNYVHFPTDVLCGALLGVLSALLVMFVFRKTKLEHRLSVKK